MASSDNHQSPPAAPSLLEDMQAEFGHCWLDEAHDNKITARQIQAIEIALEHASQSLPYLLRESFTSEALAKMNMKFNRNFRGITEDQFHVAIGIISQHITQFRERFDIRDVYTSTEYGLWRTFFQRVTRSETRARNVL